MPGWTERYLLLATLYCKCQNRSISIIFRMRQSTSIKIFFWWRYKLINMFLSRFWINTNLFLFNCELSHTKYVCSLFFLSFFQNVIPFDICMTSTDPFGPKKRQIEKVNELVCRFAFCEKSNQLVVHYPLYSSFVQTVWISVPV